MQENLKKLANVFKKVEIPLTIIVLILTTLLTIYSASQFNTKAISVQNLENLYISEFKNTDLIWLAVGLIKNLIIWSSIHIFGKNFIIAAILLILIPRLIQFPLTNRTMRLSAMQGILKLEHIKMKKFYAKAEEDAEVKSMYTQDSMRLPKKFGIITTEFIASQMLSFIPIMLISWGVSQVIYPLQHIKGLTSGIIDMTKPFWGFAIVLSVLMVLQMYIPMKNQHGPTAEQQKTILFIMPVMMGWVFLNQPAIIPMVWSVSYLISLVQTLYYYRIKKFDRETILGRK